MEAYENMTISRLNAMTSAERRAYYYAMYAYFGGMIGTIAEKNKEEEEIQNLTECFMYSALGNAFEAVLDNLASLINYVHEEGK